MKKCNSCGININTNYDYCPFCQDKLVGESFSYYPKHKRKKMLKLEMIFFILQKILKNYLDIKI